MKTFTQCLHKKLYAALLLTGLSCLLYTPSLGQENTDIGSPQNKYVGVDACIECHEDIVKTYRATSGKAKSDKSIIKMREKLTDAEFKECLSCHTTGYGQPTGFVSFESTPHLAVVGCESCHGMGYLHTQDQSADSIEVQANLELCVQCHNDAKVPRIHYDGRVHAGGH